jgi:hypothetical protein
MCMAFTQLPFKRNLVRMIVSIGSNCGRYPDSIMCIETSAADDARCFLLPPGHSKDVTVYIMHDCVALASESQVFTFSNVALLESECHVIVRSCLDISNSCAAPEHLNQASSILFAQDSGVFVSKLDFIFKDLTKPCHVTKTCTGLFALDERSASADSSLQLFLLNDGRIISPLCYMTPLHPAQGDIPKWMIPPASSDIVRMHCRVAEQIELVQSAAASASELRLSGSLWKDQAHVVLKCVRDTPDALADVQGWVSHMKCVQQKIIRNECTPLPLSARGRFLHGHFEVGGVQQQLQVSLTGEGLLFVEHMKLWTGSVVHAEGSLHVRVSNVFSEDRLGEGSFVVTFDSTEHRDEGMLVLHRMIQAFADEQRWAETVLQIINSSIDATMLDRSSHHQAMVSKRGSVADIPRYLCNVWQTDPSEFLAEIFNCYRSSFSHSIFDFPPSHCPPVLPLLTRAIKQLFVKYPHQFNEGLSVSVRLPFEEHTLSYSSIFRIVYTQPDVEGSLGAEEAFRNVQACVWFWTFRAIAEAAPAALLAKDDDGDTFMYNLLLKHECSYLTDQSFMQRTLKMIVEVEPLLGQQRLDEDPNKTILHALCLNIHNVPDSFRVIEIILQQYPDFVSLPMPTEQNELPLHWLCCSNPSPRVLRLLLDAFPSSATTADDDGCWPIHSFVTSCRCPESLQMLLDAAPSCMQQSSALGVYPLHSAVSRWSHKGKIPDEYLVPLLRACRGIIALDFCHRKSKAARIHFLGRLREWAAGSGACAHSHLVRDMLTLDIAGCELGPELVPVLSELLPHCSELTVLDISANGLTRENLEHLLPVILQLPKLQRLVLDDNMSEEEDVAIVMSMLYAPQLDVKLRCKTSQSDDDCLKDILWQAHAEEDGDDDDDGCSSDEQSGDEEGADDDDDDDSAEAASDDGCSEGSGWVTDEEHADDACERDERVSAAGDGEDGLHEDLGHLRRLHHALQRTLNAGSQSTFGCCRCEGVYDSDEGDLDISVICGDDGDRNEDDDADAIRTEVTVDREHLLESSLDALQHMSAKAALRNLDVNFKDERGIDAGGLTKTFLTMVRRSYFFVLGLHAH